MARHISKRLSQSDATDYQMLTVGKRASVFLNSRIFFAINSQDLINVLRVGDINSGGYRKPDNNGSCLCKSRKRVERKRSTRSFKLVTLMRTLTE